MKPGHAVLIMATAALLVALVVILWRTQEAPSPVPAAGTGTVENWFLALDNPETLARAFEDAARAGESGDIGAVRAIDQLLVTCGQLIGYVREGGSKERWLQGQYPPPAGRPDPEWHYARCAAVAGAPAGKLSHEYWQAVALRLDDPLYRAFGIAEAMADLKHAAAADRAAIRERIADDVEKVLRSGDAAAWVDLGSRAIGMGMTSDRGSALALMMAGCERGYDCTSANPANIFLDCRVNGHVECGSATSLLDRAKQDATPAVNARAHSRHLELSTLIQQNDWDGIARFLTLDGEPFN